MSNRNYEAKVKPSVTVNSEASRKMIVGLENTYSKLSDLFMWIGI